MNIGIYINAIKKEVLLNVKEYAMIAYGDGPGGPDTVECQLCHIREPYFGTDSFANGRTKHKDFCPLKELDIL